MEKYIINVRIIDKNRDEFADVAIKDGKISGIGDFKDRDNVTDGKNLVLMPAFVDLHVHFRDPGFTYKEDLKSGSLSALKGGYTAVNLMGNTKPVCDNMDIYSDIMKRGKELDLVDINQVIAVTENLEGKILTDMDNFDKSVKYLSDDGKGVVSTKVMYNALIKAKKNNLGIMVHAEDMDISSFDYRAAEDVMTIRDVYLAKITGTHVHFSHVSTADSLKAIIQGKQEGVNVTCEVTPHHISLFDMDYKVHPPIRSRKDVEYLIQGIKDGYVDAIATDHAPHTAEEKAKGSPGLVGLETAFCVSYTSLVRNNGLNLKDLSKVMSFNGAKLLKLNKGLIEVGYDADLVLLDLDKKIKVNADEFVSKSKNTPFNDKEFFGEVVWTMKSGNIKYQRREINAD